MPDRVRREDCIWPSRAISIIDRRTAKGWRPLRSPGVSLPSGPLQPRLVLARCYRVGAGDGGPAFGLQIARGLVEAQSREIRVEQTPGGARFCVTRSRLAVAEVPPCDLAISGRVVFADWPPAHGQVHVNGGSIEAVVAGSSSGPAARLIDAGPRCSRGRSTPTCTASATRDNRAPSLRIRDSAAWNPLSPRAPRSTGPHSRPRSANSRSGAARRAGSLLGEARGGPGRRRFARGHRRPPRARALCD